MLFHLSRELTFLYFPTLLATFEEVTSKFEFNLFSEETTPSR